MFSGFGKLQKPVVLSLCDTIDGSAETHCSIILLIQVLWVAPQLPSIISLMFCFLWCWDMVASFQKKHSSKGTSSERLVSGFLLHSPYWIRKKCASLSIYYLRAAKYHWDPLSSITTPTIFQFLVSEPGISPYFPKSVSDTRQVLQIVTLKLFIPSTWLE